MALADPQSVTHNAVAKSMPRVEVAPKKAIYQNADETFKLTVSHQIQGGRDSQVKSALVRLDQRKIVTDPLTSTNDYGTMSIRVIIERPLYGFSMTEMEQLVAALTGWLTVANVDKLYGEES